MKLPENTHILSDAPIPAGAFVVQRATMVREKKTYEEADQQVPVFELLLPFETNYETFFNVPALESVGIIPQKFAAQIDQLLKENLGNNLKARIKKGAAATPPVWVDQSTLNALYADYDFSGIRTGAAESEDDLTDEEIELRRQLRKTLKDYLRDKLLIGGMPSLTVQKVKDAEKDNLPAGTFPLAAFEEMVLAAASRAKWTFDWTRYGITISTAAGPVQLGEYEIDWGTEPRFTADGRVANPAAIVQVCQENAAAAVATARANAARMKPAALVAAADPTAA